MQEAKSASALNHPNIVTVYDVDNGDGVDFIAMEYIDGQTLDHRIGSRGMRLNLALKYTFQVADALSRAHWGRDCSSRSEAGECDGRQARTSEGARLRAGQVDEKGGGEIEATVTQRPDTEQGTIVGTVSYMSPEQAEGKPADARSDIFSFGSLLYEMVTGAQAFQDETKMSTLSAILSKNPEPVTAKAPGIPHELERIVTRRQKLVKAVHIPAKPEPGTGWSCRRNPRKTGSIPRSASRDGKIAQDAERITFGTGIETKPAFSADGQLALASETYAYHLWSCRRIQTKAKWPAR